MNDSRPLTLYQVLFATGLILSLVILNACQSPTTPPLTTIPPSPTAVEPTKTSTPSQTQAKSTSPAEGLPTITTSPSPVHSPTCTPTPKAPQFSLPCAPETVQATWRPPLYPIPWAPNPHDHFYFQHPIKAMDIEYPASNYGYGAVYFEDVVHTGIDIPGEIGTPILAAGDGKVIWTGYGFYRGGSNIMDDPYGKAVAIKHNFGYKNQKLYTVYAHLDEITTKEGQIVKAGDQIGLMGETGHATGPHLHFEVRVGENDYYATRNPDLWIAPPQGWGLLVGQIRDWNGQLLENQRVNLHSNLNPEEQNTEADRLYVAETYKNQAINQDPYYHENLVISNLQAGHYQINIFFFEIPRVFTHIVEIHPGEVTYFTFQLWEGFTTGPPPTPEIQFTPAP